MKYLKSLLSYLTSKSGLRILGILIFFLVIWKVDLPRVLTLLKSASFLKISYGVLLSIPLLMIRSYRWNRLKRIFEITVPILESFYLQLLGQMGNMTPGKAGEFIKAIYLKSDGEPLGLSAVSVIFDRLFDVLVVVSVAGVASTYFFPGLIQVNVLSGSMLIGLIVLAVTVAYFRVSLFAGIRSIMLTLIPDWVENRVGDFSTTLKCHLQKVTVVELFTLVTLTLLAFVLQVLRILFFSQALNISVSFLPLAGIVAILSLSNMLPVSFMGLGTRDAVFLYFFGLLGVAPENSIGVSFIILANIIIFSSLGFLLFILDPPSFQLDQFIASKKSQEEP
ncbi:MAG: lysylphosphatidylglycerol synthase transmembrane domain-containing protein [bacterium]